MKYEFKDSNVIVVGGASGLGLSLVKKLLLEEANVYVIDVNEKRLRECRNNLSSFGEKLHCAQADASDEDAVRSAFKAITTGRKISLVISCIGTALISPFEQITKQQWERVLAVNLTGTFHVLQNTVSHMLENDGGTIMVVSSESGVLPSPYCAGYAATKFGIVGMCDSLRYELKDRGIRVITVCPGEFRSNLGETSMRMGTMRFDAKNAGMDPDDVADRMLSALDTDEGILVITKEELHPLFERDFRYFVNPSEETLEFELEKSRARAKRFGF